MPHESTVDHASVMTPTNHIKQKLSVANEGKFLAEHSVTFGMFESNVLNFPLISRNFAANLMERRRGQPSFGELEFWSVACTGIFQSSI